MPNLTGQSIGRYHILEQLGEGGMATVYKAYDTRLERNVAFKVLRTDLFGQAVLEQVLKRFEREAKSLAKLSHPNIVNILDYGEHEGSPYLVMEYLPGGTLKQKLGQVIPWREALQTLLPVASGLSYAHQHGVIHRDVKPANILMKEGDVPVLTDFGIAKLLEGADGHTLTASGVGIGTPEYMAPEQGIGASAIDARADIYSLGIVLYEMVTGRKPYIADTPMAVVLKQMTDPLPRPTDFVPDLPEGVERILLKALAKEPDDRYADMNAMLAAMEGALTETKKFEAPVPVTPTPKERGKKKAAPSSFKRAMTVVGALGVILFLVLGMSWAAKQLSAESEAKATSTSRAAVPSTSRPPTSTASPVSTVASAPAPRIREKDGMVMVYIPAGAFRMGSKDGEPDENPVHNVTLDAFWMDQHEVTNAMYKLCVDAGACKAPTSGVRYNEAGYEDFPVVHVDWHSAQAYCEWVGSPNGTGITRLPSEAEWEYAARGGLAGRTYPWGDEAPVCAPGAETGANSAECSKGIMAVKTFQPNGYGLYDMAGNVYEWVNDWYDAGYYSDSPARNPQGPSSGEFRVVRDGSWYGGPSVIFAREGVSPDAGDYGIGFRCAGSAEGGEVSSAPTASKPAWVTNFAEPILAAIKDREPYFQDDFGPNTQGWGSGYGDRPISIEEGVMRLKQGGSVYNVFLRNMPNYVFQVDISRPASCCIDVRLNGGSGGDINIYIGPDGWEICRGDNCIGDNDTISPKNEVIVIVKNSQAGFYLAGNPVFYFEDPNLADMGQFGNVNLDCFDQPCEFDNVKFWNLDKVPIP